MISPIIQAITKHLEPRYEIEIRWNKALSIYFIWIRKNEEALVAGSLFYVSLRTNRLWGADVDNDFEIDLGDPELFKIIDTYLIKSKWYELVTRSNEIHPTSVEQVSATKNN